VPRFLTALALSVLLGSVHAVSAQEDTSLPARFELYRKHEHELGALALEMRRGQERLLQARRALRAFRQGKRVDGLTKPQRVELDRLEANLLEARGGLSRLLDGKVGKSYRRAKGEVEAELKRLAQDLGRALAKGGSPLLRRMRASLLVDKGRFELALRDLKQVLVANPKDALGLTLRGRCREATGQTEKALADYSTALGLEPTDERRLRAAVALFWLNRFVEARKLRDAVSELGPLPAQLQLDYAWHLAAPKLENVEKRWQRELVLRAEDAKRGDLPRIELKTTHGRIVIELYEDQVPNTVAALLTLVKQGFYDKLAWHRVQPLRLAVTGKPRAPVKGDAAGPGFATPSEIGRAPRHHFRGSVGWLSRGPRKRGGSQLYLMFRPDAELDGECAVIGRIVEGIERAAALRQGDLVESAKILRKRKHPYTVHKEGL
jgi:cyclophilin family peptidyl-prolyl cis-trans isomerase